MRYWFIKSFSVLLLLFFNFSLSAQCWKITSAGVNHTLAIKTNGTLWTWGFNGSGQLGDGSGNNKAEPIQIGTDTDWITISAGGNHSLAIKADGSLWAWGDNLFGQVGDGTFGNQRNIPVKIGTSTNWKSIVAGRTFSLAIKTDGTLWAWGDNSDGQLGHQSVSFSPLQVGTSTNWKSVSAGGFHTLALKTDGTLWAWGSNTNGQLGDGTTNEQSIPKQIGIDIWNTISAGHNFSLALKTDGTLWAWGANNDGQLGNATYTDQYTPAKIGTALWQAIETGYNSSLAIHNDGTLWAWGWKIGSVGPSDNSANIPTQIGIAQWTSIALGEFHALGSQTDESTWSWGNNDWGELGTGLLNETTEPARLSAAKPSGEPLQTFCQSGLISDLKVSGTGIKWYSALSGGSPLLPSTQLTDKTHYFASETKYGCESQDRIEVIVNINTTPTAPPSGPTSQHFCGVTSVSELLISGTNIQWFNTSTGGIPLNETDLLTNGFYYVTQTIENCESSRLEVSVSLNLIEKPSGQTTQSLCDGAVISDLNVTGANIKWYSSENSTTELESSTKLNNGATYYATQTLDLVESCQRLPVLASITTTAPPTGLTIQEICMQGTIADLQALGNNILWFESPAAENALDHSLQLVDAQHYYAGQFDNGCLSKERLDVTVLVNTTPSPGGEPVQYFCFSGTLEGFTLTGSNIKWYDAPAGGEALPLTTEIINGKNYYASQTIEGRESCLRFNVVPFIRPDVAPEGYVQQAFCNQGKVSELTTWSSYPVLWYSSSTGGTPLSPDDQLTSGHYFASQTISSCETKQRLDVSVIVNTDITPAPTGPSSQFSCGGFLLQLDVTGSNIKWYSSSNGDTPLDPFTLVANGGHYFASQTVYECESFDRLEIFTEAQPMTSSPEPLILGNWLHISSHPWADHNIGIKTDGTLWGWGDNMHGQLGNGTTNNTMSYATLLNTESWKAIETGRTHTVGIKSDGTLWTWGNELATFQEGTDKSVPVKISSNTTWSMISVGGYHTLALKTDGTLWAWGRNSYGQLGNGTTIDQMTPIQIGTDNTWKFISAGHENSYAIKADGTLWGWGDDPTALMNIYGNNQLTPARIRETDNNWKMISAGVDLCLAIKTDGTLWAMGAFNINNGIGNLLPVQVGSETNWETVSTGAEHAVGIKKDGTLWAVWGQNVSGELGDSPFLAGFSTVPQRIGSSTDWHSTEVGSFRSLLMKTNGSLWAIGYNHIGQLSVIPEYDYPSYEDHHIRVPRLVQSLNLSSECQPRTVADLQANGSQINWYAQPYGGSPLPLTTAIQHGTHYYATQTVGQCESLSRLRVTELNMIAPAPIGESIQSFCKSSTIADLSAFGKDIKWYNAPAGGLLLTPSTQLVHGVHYYGAQNIDGCESQSRLDVTAYVNSDPIDKPSGNALQSLCIGSTIEQLDVTGTMIQWYSIPTGGSALPASTILENGSHYYASQTTNSCESAERLDITVQIQTTESPTLLSQATFCSDQQATLASLEINGTAVLWYNTSSAGSPLPESTLLVNGTHYYASQTINSCESLERLEIIPQIQFIAAPEFIAPAEFCLNGNSTVAALLAAGTNIKWYGQSAGGEALPPSTLLINNKSYFATQTVNGCESTARLMLTVNLNPKPQTPTGNSVQSFEAGSKVEDINVSGTQLKWYTSQADAQVGLNAITPSQILVDGETYYVTQTLLGCESDPLSVTVTLIITSIEPDGILEFYPNPVDHILTISFSKVIDNLSIVNALGKQVLNQKVSSNQIELDLSNLERGIYIIHIKHTDTVISKKVIKL